MQRIEKRLKCHTNNKSHSYIADRFDTVSYPFSFKTDTGTCKSGNPDYEKNQPSPKRCMTKNRHGKKSISSCNMEIDGDMIEFPKERFSLSLAASMVKGRGDVRKKHANNVDRYTAYRPAVTTAKRL